MFLGVTVGDGNLKAVVSNLDVVGSEGIAVLRCKDSLVKLPEHYDLVSSTHDQAVQTLLRATNSISCCCQTLGKMRYRELYMISAHTRSYHDGVKVITFSDGLYLASYDLRWDLR